MIKAWMLKGSGTSWFYPCVSYFYACAVLTLPRAIVRRSHIATPCIGLGVEMCRV